ncbi:MAG: RluA family pseudouridine synthase [Candidatus Cryosericum sp.]|nr:RluA family pseudouridine synthase [bacterium]
MAEVSLGRVTVPILYLDNDIVAVNKPAGLPVLTVSGKMEGTLSEVVLAGGVTLYEGHGVELAGVVHRLDKDTSGVMLLARTEAGWNSFKRQLNEHEARKEYLAIVRGVFGEKSGQIDIPIGAVHARGLLLRQADSSGRDSRTSFGVIQHYGELASLVRIRIETGRTHQIRVHFSYIGHPLLGDYMYGYREQRGVVVTRQMLHAFALSFMVPSSGLQVRIMAPLPEDFRAVLRALRR